MKLKGFAKQGVLTGFLHWCPGCDGPHAIHVYAPSEATGAQWAFDGNLEEPTFTPSIRVLACKDGPTICHYFLRGGVLEFCGDSAHSLRGTQQLPDWPEI